MKRIVFILICAVVFSFFISNVAAETDGLYKVRVTISDLNGNIIDPSQTRAFISCGKALAWGKSRVVHAYSIGELNFEATDQYIEFTTSTYGDILFTISIDNEDYACFISDTINKQELKNDRILEKTYNLKGLKKIALKANFMNTYNGKYEVSIYNPLNTNYEADNYGSLFEMEPNTIKDLYLTPGKYNYVFKYIGKGVCAYTYKDNVSALETKSVSLTKDNVSLKKYSYKIPEVLEQYVYYIMHVDKDNHRAYLTGLFSDSSTLDFYMDKRLTASSQNLILSKDPDNEYKSSVWLSRQNKVPENLGNSFNPGNIEIFNADQNKRGMRIGFADLNGNSINFIDMEGSKDIVVEVYDKYTGIKLYCDNVSRYWDYFNPKLKDGNYIAKIYPLEKSLGMDGCSYYELKVDSSNPALYIFSRMFSLKM